MHLKVCNLSKVDTSKNRAVEFTVEVKGWVFFVAVSIVFFPLKKGRLKENILAENYETWKFKGLAELFWHFCYQFLITLSTIMYNQVDFFFICVAQYVNKQHKPCGHCLQTPSPWPEKVPRVQFTGSTAGSRHCFPAGHGRHTDDPLWL